LASRHIVLGLDGSSGSDVAARWCVEYAPLLDAEVVAIHAVPPIAQFVPSMAASPTPNLYDPEIYAASVRALEDWCTPLREAGVPYRALVVDAVPAQALMDTADEVDATMIVVGRRGHGGFAELVLGSLPHTLSHHARRPILVVPLEV
jgi:nucleotide-binding universal stress UspA family protein